VTQGAAPSGYDTRARVKPNQQVRHGASLARRRVMSGASEQQTAWVPKTVLNRLMCAAAIYRCMDPNCGASHLEAEAVDLAAAEVQRAGEILQWLHWLEWEDAMLALMRAGGAPWKAVCRYFDISRATANRRLEYGLSVIAWRLNGGSIPATWSRRFLVERFRASSRRL
jgi:hypothetical protein